jgi:hypothetical protein
MFDPRRLPRHGWPLDRLQLATTPVPLKTLCHDLQDLGFATSIRESDWLFPTIETVHVLALALVVGSIMMVDLRLLGLAYKRRPISELMTEVLPWTWSAFVVAVVAGSLMFSSKAVTYYDSLAFRIKMICLVLAGLNMLCFHLFTYQHVAESDHRPVPLAAKCAGALSLMLWMAIVASGRWIGFTT